MEIIIIGHSFHMGHNYWLDSNGITTNKFRKGKH